VTEEEHRAADEQMGVFMGQLTPQQRSELAKLYVDPTGIRNLLEWTLKAMEGKPNLDQARVRTQRYLDIVNNPETMIQAYIDLFRR